MVEKRAFHRVRLTAKSMLSHDDAMYQGQLENISLNGALVRLDQAMIVPQGGEYTLSVYIEDEDIPLRLVVEVVCATYTLAGIKFISCEADTEARLGQLVEKLTSEQNLLRSEQEKFRKNLADYLR